MADQTASARHGGMGYVCWCVMVVLAVAGCASDKPKPMPQPSSEQVKGNADRTFEKLKQEERERKAVGQ